MRTMRCGLLSMILLLSAFQAFAAAPKTWCVDPTNTKKCFATINAAIAAASNGDTIQIAAGTYAEDISLLKNLSFIGAGAGLTVVDDTSLSTTFDLVDVVGGYTARFSGITFHSYNGRVMYIQSQATVTIDSCTFEGPFNLGNTTLIQSAGTLTVRDSTLGTSNVALDLSGTASLTGLLILHNNIGIRNYATTNVTNSVIHHNNQAGIQNFTSLNLTGVGIALNSIGIDNSNGGLFTLDSSNFALSDTSGCVNVNNCY